MIDMRYCTNCGTSLDSDSLYCTNCGTKTNQSKIDATTTTGLSSLTSTSSNLHNYIPYQDRYQLDKRTAELKIILIVEYFLLATVIFSSLLLLIAVPFLGLALLVLSGLYFWLIYSLQQFSNIARIITIIFSILGLVLSIPGINFVGIVFCIFQIYALGFHKRTIESFTKNPKLK